MKIHPPRRTAGEFRAVDGVDFELFRLKQDGVALILTTHSMDEAEQLCDLLVVLDRGQILARGTPRELSGAHVTLEVLELRFPVGEQESSAERIRGRTHANGDPVGTWVEALPDRVTVYADDGAAALATIQAMLLSPLTTLVRRATLEDVFLS
jgi:lipooligosaccharide transport system ATP-binding protein